MMNKHIFYYLMVGSMALLLGACNDSMNDLLEPKVYFESKEYNFSVEDEMDVMPGYKGWRLSDRSCLLEGC